MTAYPGVAQFRPRHTQRDVEWQDLAACREKGDPDWFFDERKVELALQVCRECPVQKPCGEIRYRAEGVWGGRAIYDRRKR